MGIYSTRIKIQKPKSEKSNNIDNDTQDKVNEFEDHNNIEIIDNDTSLDELEKQYTNWINMPDYKKRLSDNKCIDTYGKDNIAMYHSIKADLLEKNKDLYDDEIIYRPCNESSDVTNKYISLNLDKFENGESNILLVTGLSGSGKTTLANDIAKQYKADVVEIDIFDYNKALLSKGIKDPSKGDKLVIKFFEENPKLKKVDMLHCDYKKYCKYLKQFVNWIIDYSKKSKKKIILEGIHLYAIIDYNDIEEYPIIIMNTGAIQSMVRRWKRNGGGISVIKKLIFPGSTGTADDISWYYNDKQIVDRLKKVVKGRNVYDDLKSKNLEKISQLQAISEEPSNVLEASSIMMELNSIKDCTSYEKVLIEKTNYKLQKEMNKKLTDIFDFEDNLPYFEPEVMEEMGISQITPNNNYYGVTPDNKVLNEKVSVKEWYEDYILASKGIISENRNKYTALWLHKLNELYSDYDEIKQSGDNLRLLQRKQSILELGWNPEIAFIPKVRKKVTENMRQTFKNNNLDIDVINLSEFTNSISIDDNDIINESSNHEDLYPVFVVLTYTGTTFGKLIRYYTKSTFSHSGLSLDSKMDRIYTFNANQNGFSIEDIKKYNQTGQAAIYAIFVTKDKLMKLKSQIDYYLANHDKTRYSFINIIGIMLNKSIEFSNDMICSQFVDTMLKSINRDVTHKRSGLVLPEDFTKVKKKTFYKVFQGNIKDYDERKVDKVIKTLQGKLKRVNENLNITNEVEYTQCLYENCNDLNTLMYLEEGYTDLSDKNKEVFDKYISPYLNIPINEAKELPVQFDDDGNLFIKNFKNGKMNFDDEYMRSHKLLKIYKESSNIEGIKYELSKLWSICIVVERHLDTEKSAYDKKKLYNTRARVLNDFNKYLKFIYTKESDFNFTSYYEQTPFCDAFIKINNSTLKYSGKIIATLMKFVKFS